MTTPDLIFFTNVSTFKLSSARVNNEGVMHNTHITLSKKQHTSVLSCKQIQLRKINKKDTPS